MKVPPSPAEIAPVDTEEFITAYRYAGMVAENELLEQVPAMSTASIETPDGTFGFTNHPANLFGFAIMRYFQDQPDKAQAFMWRFWGFQILLRHDAIKKYISGTGDRRRIHTAVLKVAATEKLSDMHEFEPVRFFRKVREVAARMDIEEAGNS